MDNPLAIRQDNVRMKLVVEDKSPLLVDDDDVGSPDDKGTAGEAGGADIF